MSVSVLVQATVKVRVRTVAASAEEGLAQTKAMLPQCRLLPPPRARMHWLERLFARPLEAVAEVTAAEVVSSTYAGGE